MSFDDDTLDPSNRESYIIQQLVDAVGELLHESGEQFRLEHPELLDAYQAITEYTRRRL
jgi:hypothetical protein